MFEKVDENCDEKINDKKKDFLINIQEKIEEVKSNKNILMYKYKHDKNYKEKIEGIEQKINYLEKLRDRMNIAINSNDYETIYQEYEQFKKKERQITKK